jgi:hypothetical protein
MLVHLASRIVVGLGLLTSPCGGLHRTREKESVVNDQDLVPPAMPDERVPYSGTAVAIASPAGTEPRLGGSGAARTRRTESSTELAAMVAADPVLQQQLKVDPVGTLQKLAAPLETDIWIYRIVVGSLAAAALLVVIGVFVLVVIDSSVKVPDAMIAIGSAAIAAMAALLVPRSR